MRTSLDPINKVAAKDASRLTLALVISAFVVVPVLVAPFPPSTDLPQHLAQIRLFQAALADPSGPYVIQWAGPNNLIYAFLAGLWAVLPHEWVPRAAIGLILLAWVAAIHGLAASRRRPVAAGVVASLLIFNQSLYWGFLNFLVGFPIFVLWFGLATGDEKRISWKRWLALAGTAFLLYESHALWLAAGGAWLILSGLIEKLPLKLLVLRLTALIPCGVIAAFWYPSLSAARATAGFDVAAHWSPLFDRLASFLDAAFGGMRGPVETVAFVFIYFWVGTAVWQNRKRLREATDFRLLSAGLFLLVIVLAAPDKYMNTIFFSSRWFPPATIFLLLALPLPVVPRISAKVVAVAAVLGFCLAAAVSWYRFNATDLSGFNESLEKIPAGSRVLGLDLVKESEIIKGKPFLQLTAYAQAFKGCDLNFSFAEHYSGLVAYKRKRDIRWTPGLEWYAEKVQRSDFKFFDYVLVNGGRSDFRILEGIRELVLATEGSPWRLYWVAPDPK